MDPQQIMNQVNMMQQQNNNLLNKLFDSTQPSMPVGQRVNTGTSIAQLRGKKQQVVKQDDPSETEVERNNISSLVRDINKSLDDYEPSRSNTDDEDDDIIDEQDQNDAIIDTKPSYIPSLIQEGLLIIVIYVILSQEYVRGSIGKFITYINPDETGKVHLAGYVSYGTILAVLYLFFKRILF